MRATAAAEPPLLRCPDKTIGGGGHLWGGYQWGRKR